MPLTPNDIKRLYEVKDLILEDFSRHYTIEQIAALTTLSPTKLKKGFKLVFGSGPFEYFETARLEKAKKMMSDRNISLKQISKKVGFKYQNNFSKAFKKRFGMTPGAWRKTLDTVVLFSGQLFRLFVKLASFATI